MAGLAGHALTTGASLLKKLNPKPLTVEYAYAVFRAPRRVPLALWPPWLRRDSGPWAPRASSGGSRPIFSILRVLDLFLRVRGLLRPPDLPGASQAPPRGLPGASQPGPFQKPAKASEKPLLFPLKGSLQLSGSAGPNLMETGRFWLICPFRARNGKI